MAAPLYVNLSPYSHCVGYHRIQGYGSGTLKRPKPITDLPDSHVTPAPVFEKRTRRKISTEYKLRMITKAEASETGDLR